MEKIKIIVNPSSGKEQTLTKVKELITLFSQDGFKVNICFTKKKYDAEKFASEDENEDLIICMGGDGTLNEVVNGMYKANIKTPLAILPGGTVNDFATALNLPSDTNKFYNMIKRMKVKPVDLGIAGDRVFANVAAGGLLTKVAYQVEDEKKSMFGRLAYYTEGLREISKFRSGGSKDLIEVDIKCDEFTGKEKILMFIIANSASVGGFKNMAPKANVYDGYFDVLIVKEMNLKDLPTLLGSFLESKHIIHDKIKYIRTKEITISANKEVKIDTDGEEAGDLPTTFKVLENAINLVLI